MNKLIEIYNNWYTIEREIKGREKQEKKTQQNSTHNKIVENKKKYIHLKLMKQ